MIPKVFHRVWVGGKLMPEHFARWGRGWLEAHPGWTMKVWTEKEVQSLENHDLLARCSSLAQQSDIIRYEVLFREGGIYLDTDMECLKNIEPLLDGVDLFACWQKSGFLSNAIFGAAPGNETIGKLFRQSRTNFRAHPWNAMGPPFFTPIVLASDEVRIFNRKTFIPYTRAEYEQFPVHPVEVSWSLPGSYVMNHRSSIWHADSTTSLPGGLEEARRVIDEAKYWHYKFELPWRTTVPNKPGWAERVQKRRGHFFRELLNGYGGTLEGKSVLDLGCCQGFWSFESRRARAASTLGIDSSEAFIREAEAVKAVLGVDGCEFLKFHLEEDRWWNEVEPRDVTLFLGVLYHLTDPAYVLRRAMMATKETIVVDGEVGAGDVPGFQLRPRTQYEPTTVRSNITSTVRAVPTPEAIEWILRDGGFKKIRRLVPALDMPEDYKDGRTMSFIATRT